MIQYATPMISTQAAPMIIARMLNLYAPSIPREPDRPLRLRKANSHAIDSLMIGLSSEKVKTCLTRSSPALKTAGLPVGIY